MIGGESPVHGNASLPLGEVRLKKVSSGPPPPAKEEPKFDNELLAKLKRRQESMDTPPAPPTGEQPLTQSSPLIGSATTTPTHQETTPTNQPSVSAVHAVL